MSEILAKIPVDSTRVAILKNLPGVDVVKSACGDCNATSVMLTQPAPGEVLTIFHCYGVVNYLSVCYANHLVPVIRPDMVWQVILSELARVVLKDPATYGPAFGHHGGDKVTLSVATSPAQNCDHLLPLTEALLDRAPWLRPILRDSPDEAARIAYRAVFLEAASPYYNYVMFLCGFPAIYVAGTPETWYGMRDALRLVQSLNTALDTPEIHGVCTRGQQLIESIWSLTDPRMQRFSPDGMFASARCGSGHDGVGGWWFDVYVDRPEIPKARNWNPSVGRVTYVDANVSPAKPRVSYAGVLGAMLYRDGDLTVAWPAFGALDGALCEKPLTSDKGRFQRDA
jgi:Domain of unknown function (DUF4419)